jgi:hypothetical protein
VNGDIETPDFSGTNLHYWFKPYMIKELALIEKHLDAVEDNKVREFLRPSTPMRLFAL